MHLRTKRTSSSEGDHSGPEGLTSILSESSLSKGTTADVETLSVVSVNASTKPTIPGRSFEPTKLIKSPSTITSGLPPELWTPIISTPSVFPPSYFLQVSKNLLKNPNLTSSHLFRAEIFYDSQNDASFNSSAQLAEDLSDFIQHMKAAYRPLVVPGGFPGYKLSWTVVRKLIPRNPQLDKPLVQTCHLFTSSDTKSVQESDGAKSNKLKGVDHTFTEERNLIVYLPHATSPDDIPWYHPPVRALATLYIWSPDSASPSPPGNLSFYYNLFPGTELTNRMERTALNMLKIIHKHGHGQQEGYTKRVHHDVVVPQKRFQDTYTYLKGKYAKVLIRDWVEQTPATKHVFEDLGIAAFLIELWSEMYGDSEGLKDKQRRKELETGLNDSIKADAQKKFPGFVDIGCGNGLLVYVLLKEGWSGWGFDARKRRTWDTFPMDVQEKLKEMLLVPEILQSSQHAVPSVDGQVEVPNTRSLNTEPPFHNGIFPTGTFIVSNHADELTPWTPLLASLSHSPFIAIPCCSH
ncbi:DUF1613-domain-containing protein, partial [Glonium stellatum]